MFPGFERTAAPTRKTDDGGHLMAVTDQLEFTQDELLMDSTVAEPLIAGGVRCHGGFDAEGRYVSPRTRFRTSAIAAWQRQHRDLFGAEIMDVPMETWPEHFPNLDQARFLLRAGVPEPLIATLTRIGTVEGYGANIRLLRPGNLQRFFSEDVRGTAIAHLGAGLFEAHGRDEAGWEKEAGHKDMWFAARDIAFESPTAGLDVEAMLARMGFGSSGSSQPVERRLPDSIDPDLESMVALMIRILLIEVSAFHSFRWSEAWLSDTDHVAGGGAAATLVSYIRADETPHVAYLSTALTEMRDRTWIGDGGDTFAGTEMIASLWAPLLDQSLGAGREQSRTATQGEVEYWLSKRRNGPDLLAEFNALATKDV